MSQIDGKQEFVEASLKGKSGLILVPNHEVRRSIQRMVQSCSSEILDPKPYKQMLHSENNVSHDVSPKITAVFIHEAIR